MQMNPESADVRGKAGLALAAMVLIVLMVLGGYLRFVGLGTRSLWLDEFSTWHVSRIDLRKSLTAIRDGAKSCGRVRFRLEGDRSDYLSVGAGVEHGRRFRIAARELVRCAKRCG